MNKTSFSEKLETKSVKFYKLDIYKAHKCLIIDFISNNRQTKRFLIKKSNYIRHTITMK